MDASLDIVRADLDRPDHLRDVVAMTEAYAHDAFGRGGPLPEDAARRLGSALREHPTTIVFLAYLGAEPVGIATCFLGFSTFAARPLVNVHDLAVVPAHRGKGVGQALLAAVEDEARKRGCAKLTLEVLEHNTRARRVYESVGFEPSSLFYTKAL
jgi:GNAT superfamily N-acetyltransferase